jgi:hypothetical protein
MDHLGPPPGRPRSTTAAGLQEPELIVDLQLEGGTRAIAALPGFGDIGIVELTLQPALRTVPRRSREPWRTDRRRLPRSPALLSGSGGSVIGFAIGLTHQVHQHALAQAAIGHAHVAATPATSLEDRPACERKIGAIVADARQSGASTTDSSKAGQIRRIPRSMHELSTSAVVALEAEIVGADVVSSPSTDH